MALSLGERERRESILIPLIDTSLVLPTGRFPLKEKKKKHHTHKHVCSDIEQFDVHITVSSVWTRPNDASDSIYTNVLNAQSSVFHQPNEDREE